MKNRGGAVLYLTIFIYTVLTAGNIFAQISITASNDGYIYPTASATYSTVHNASAGNVTGTNVLYTGQDGGYYIFRSFLSFAIPAGNTIQNASLFLDGNTDSSTDDYELYILTSTYSDTLVVADFDMFNGHQATGSYNGTVLNNVWNSSSYSATWNEIVYNAAGIDTLNAYKGSTHKIVLISKNDYNNIAPTTSENVFFESSATVGKKPYLLLTYASGAAPRSVLSNNGTVSAIMRNGIASPFK